MSVMNIINKEAIRNLTDEQRQKYLASVKEYKKLVCLEYEKHERAMLEANEGLANGFIDPMRAGTIVNFIKARTGIDKTIESFFEANADILTCGSEVWLMNFEFIRSNAIFVVVDFCNLAEQAEKEILSSMTKNNEQEEAVNE
jgi:hypothetical protein